MRHYAGLARTAGRLKQLLHDFQFDTLASVLAGAAVVLIAAAVIASLMPATRASRTDVMEALRSE